MFKRKYLLSIFLFYFCFCYLFIGYSFAQNESQTLSGTASTRFIVTFADKIWTLDLKEVGFDGIDPTTLDRSAFMKWIQSVVEKDVNCQPRSAFYKWRGLIPHITGQTLNLVEIERWVDHIHDYVNRPLKLPVNFSEPELTTEKLISLKEKLLGSYSTRFNPYSYSRSRNIKLSSYAIDHYVVMPGQVFSFNKAVGKATTKKGYAVSRIIVYGKFKKGVGGGICQTSSTLFNSVDNAGLEIIERTMHSKSIDYVPKNRDATVAWGGPDFKFKNQLNEPILIVSSCGWGRIYISIYGPNTISK